MDPKKDLDAIIHKRSLDCSMSARQKLYTVGEEQEHLSVGRATNYSPVLWF